MSICVVRKSNQLGMEFVLTPERYNPKRRMSLSEEDTGIRLSEIVTLKNDILYKNKISTIILKTIEVIPRYNR